MAMKTEAKKLQTLEERAIGKEDRVFLAMAPNEIDPVWYYQLRGCAEADGPFYDRRAAEEDYESLD
jgi:hypothetical protein